MFKVGEQALLVKPKPPGTYAEDAEPYFGKVVTVIKVIGKRRFSEAYWYEVKVGDEWACRCVEECLEKLPPPKREPLGTWEGVPYADLIRAPKKEPVEAGA